MKSLAEIYSGRASQEPDFARLFITSRLSRLWAIAAPANILRHTEPSRLDNNTLEVFADSPIWAQELTMLKARLIDRMRQADNSIQINDLRFRVRSRASEKPEEKKAQNLRQCKTCKVLHQGQAEKCFLCEKACQDQKIGKLFSLMRKAPWKRYEDIKEDLPKINTDDFRRAKQQIVSRLKDDLVFISFQKEIQNKPAAVKTAREFVTHKAGLKDDKITPALLKKHLGQKVYAKIFGGKK